jgi:hypothetical protein
MASARADDLLKPLLGDVEERWRTWQGMPPPVVYHYTKANVLAPILRSQAMWATLTSHLNDTRELEHANDTFKTVLRKHAADAILPEYRDLYPPLVTEFQYARPDLVTTFVSSFSGAEDDLPQWCMYADAFAGIALGFDSATLVALDRADDIRQKMGFFRVLYTDSEQLEFFEWLVSKWERDASVAWARDLPKAGNRNMFKAVWLSNLGVSALSAIPRMKSRYFSFEQDWRLAHLHNRGRAECTVFDDDGTKPHVVLDLAQITGQIPLVSVWLGPAVANDESEALVRRLLAKHALSSVSVRRSCIPLRGEARCIAL